MKKSDNSIFGLLKLLGFTPQILILCTFAILISGITIGLLVKNAQKQTTKPMKKIETNISKPQKILPQKSITQPKLKPLTKTIQPQIAIIIDDMGIDMLRTARVLELTYPLTLSYLSYAPNLQSQINLAKSKNFEIMLHIPMEAQSDTYDYGPHHLSTQKTKSQNLELLNNILNKTSGYIGINNHMGSKFTENEGQLTAIIQTLNDKGLTFVDSKTSPLSKGDIIATKISIPYIARDIFLDDSNQPQDIERSLTQLETIAKKRGFAVAIGHPRNNTIEALKKWLPEIEKRNIKLTTISEIIKTKSNKN